MILSRLFLDPRSRDVQRALGDSHSLHVHVMSMFPKVEGGPARASLRVLHRLEPSERGEELVLLVQSAKRPDATKLPAGFLAPWLDADAFASTDLTPLLGAIRPGSRFRFRLRANPTRKIDTKTGPDGKRRNGKRVPVRGEDGRARWLSSRFEAHGLKLIAVVQRPQGTTVAHARGETRTHDAHVFDGVLEVIDAARAEAAVKGGIGPGKAYGFGLLSLARE